jgi:hypothetical protein
MTIVKKEWMKYAVFLETQCYHHNLAKSEGGPRTR